MLASALKRQDDAPAMADDNSPNSLHARAIAIAVAAREQVLAAARLEIEQMRRSIDAIEPDVADVVEQLCESVQTDTAGLVLDQLALAVRALAQPTGGAQLLSTIADVFGEYFSRALVGAAEGDGFTVWHSRGFEPPLHRGTVLRPAVDTALARATEAWSTVASESTDGIAGAPARYAIALPLVAAGRGAAMVYAENGADSPADDRIAGKIAQILAETVRPRLHMKAQPAQQPSAAASSIDAAAAQKQRQAPRVKMLDGTTVVVDQAQGTLVDLSTLGAQVLSPYALRPNSPVRIVLPHEAGGVSCAARVVWVIVEHDPSAPSAVYRAGVQFTDVKAGELQGYLEFFDSGIRH